ncbi:MAG: 6-carboxytetrahydropterin synthase [Methylococcaceae bacterium]|nr:6-carboxytetrahydropterin synthase [Methylococcaceae bacterium]
MFSVTKEVYFCYGHRLMNHPGKCRNIHGHSVKAAITVTARQLNDQGMVCDFADIQRVAGEFIDGILDHNFLLHRDDPLCGVLRQSGERFLGMDEHPTAEALARFIHEHLVKKGFPVQNVTLWETASAHASYVED